MATASAAAKVLSIARDDRIGAFCATAECSYERYLTLTQTAEENLEIQRGFLNAKSYETLRADLIRGCVLPPVVLAQKSAGKTKGAASAARKAAKRILSTGTSAEIYVIDGLQRTKALRDALGEIAEEPERRKFLARRIRLEIWTHISFSAVAYRMLLLNAGQRPMSIKHQVEVLSQQLKVELEQIQGVTVLTSTGDANRRREAGQFQLAQMRSAFQAWLQGNPHVDIRNAMLEQLLTDEAVSTLGGSLSSGARQPFHDCVQWIAKVDSLLPAEDLQFFGSETVLLGISAAIGQLSRKSDTAEKVQTGLERLRNECFASSVADPLGIRDYDEVKKTIDAARRNVGQATRELVYRAFREYFVSDGTMSMRECWRYAAASWASAIND